LPERSQPQPGFHEKDWVEDYLHREDWAGRMDLAEPQREIVTNWIGEYRELRDARFRRQ
jgi:hypothetical protein